MEQSVAAEANTDEVGQSGVEYAFVVGFVCLGVVAILAAAAPAWMTSITNIVSAGF